MGGPAGTMAPMQSLRTTLARIPPGSAVLFFIQMVSTLGYAVLYSSLVLYADQGLRLGEAKATAIMGVFGAFNYGLHLFGGVMGGRLLSNRNLFVGGMLLQVLGCAAIAWGAEPGLYWGLALFLTGSGLNVTCLNMMLTQRFAPEDSRREAAFLWNYAGMNVGFFIGFAAAGHFQLQQDYESLFLFATLGNAAAVLLALAYWRSLADRDTPLLQQHGRAYWGRFAAGLAILLLLVPALEPLLRRPGETALLLKGLCAAVALYLAFVIARHPVPAERRRMQAYGVLTLGSLVFWSLYQMAPSGLQLFALNHVEMRLAGWAIAPQWVQNINTVVIVVGGPWLAQLFARWRARGWPVDVPSQFAVSLLLMGLGFLALPLGVALAGADGKVGFVWLAASYVLQSLGELLIAPIGYAMIGRLAPAQHQGLLMGAWMMVTGLASLFAADFSGWVAQPPEGAPAGTALAAYGLLFTQLGVGSLLTGVLLLAAVRWLRGLMEEARA